MTHERKLRDNTGDCGRLARNQQNGKSFKISCFHKFFCKIDSRLENLESFKIRKFKVMKETFF